MVYTLVSAATLGFDLARLPAGREVADVLLAGLLADGPALAALARQHRTRCVLDDPGTTPRADAGQARRARELAVAGGSSLSAVPAGPAAPATLVAQLELSTLGDVTALERLVHGELVEAPPEADERTADLAREVLADAAVAGYAARALPEALRRLLAAAHHDARPHLPVAAAEHLGPHGARVLAVLDVVATPTRAARRRWVDAAEALRARDRAAAADGTGEPGGAWARAMHDACWAAHLSGRTRLTAAAQLLAVRALHDAGTSAADAAGGVWNAVAGVVQATVLADLLTDELLDQLLAPWALVTAP